MEYLISFLVVCGLAVLALKKFDESRDLKKRRTIAQAPHIFLKNLDKISRDGLRYVGATASVADFNYEHIENTYDGYQFRSVCQTESKKWFIHEFTLYLRDKDRIFNEAVYSVDESWVRGEFSSKSALYIRYFGVPELA